ncbi:GNAT family N-acetyltransferase [Psychrobium sp. 1_MG-2023]|uniref:GNAT family N-acetyltransferase n=1 Tax=Psychrobium sp. 1_MG-2023 TaxID=3062624 RepID=UPI000C324347|nr:GNAT family N-acetyltransferase [Psychrobium sp. 1_MG-2023]MDP2562443.1 GNAT family N-acetyltransferase [Psychrobium sp. 1_MG-2023]PKF56169.1 GNAT family N-acetyltransferase [Alteromonadales bacterium alter-6D02]
MKLTTPQPPKEHEFEALKLGLNGFNESITGTVHREKVATFIKDDTGVVIGGILGEINWHWLHIQGLWVDKSMSGQGWGSQLMESLECYAMTRGITNIRLETTAFQALDFYLKLGYSIFGKLPDMPKGYTSYFLQKQLKAKE